MMNASFSKTVHYLSGGVDYPQFYKLLSVRYGKEKTIK